MPREFDHFVPVNGELCFHDFLPAMMEKMGEENFMEELRKAFRILADPDTCTITPESLKENAPALGLDGMTDQEFREMIKEGDTDGDGALTEREFVVLIIRSSPALLEQAGELLFDAVDEELSELLDDDKKET